MLFNKKEKRDLTTVNLKIMMTNFKMNKTNDEGLGNGIKNIFKNINSN